MKYTADYDILCAKLSYLNLSICLSTETCWWARKKKVKEKYLHNFVLRGLKSVGKMFFRFRFSFVLMRKFYGSVGPNWNLPLPKDVSVFFFLCFANSSGFGAMSPENRCLYGAAYVLYFQYFIEKWV